MKYIATREDVIIFTPTLTHLKMMQMMRIKQEDVTSAGFFSCDPDSVHVFGDSYSIGIKSDPGVADRISRTILGY